MKRKIGTFCMFMGTAFVIAALSLFLYNQWDNNRAGEASDNVVTQLEATIDGKKEPKLPRMSGEMTTVNIDGYDYIGYLSIPAIDLKLPVMSEWSYEGLKIAPGRFSGATFTKDLVICGHNYGSHFGDIRWLDIGTKITFKDMDGWKWKYKVVAIETLEPTQVENMTTKTATDKWDMTLFTCNTGGQTRCAIRCASIDETA